MKKLFQLFEAADTQERLQARLRKRRQRDKEKAVRQTNPYALVLVVKNKMNNEVLIIDKESYTPQYHEIILSSDQLNQATLKSVLDNPSFVQTETSKRLFGDIKQNKSAQPEQQQAGSGQASGESQSGGGGGQMMSTPPMPKPSIPFTEKNIVSGPVMALGMMSGLQTNDLKKLGITDEELMEFNSSDEIQQISFKIAKDIAFYFEKIYGRNILEYDIMITKDQIFPTTPFWKMLGGFDTKSKSEIVFRHKCIGESAQNKKCQSTMCACTEAAVVPSEYQVQFTVKFGNSALFYGKLNHNQKAIAYSSIVAVDNMLNSADPKEILVQFDEKEKEQLKKLQSDIDFLKKITKDYFSNKNNDGEDESSIKKLDKFIEDIHSKIERILNSNLLYKELFLHEALSGYFMFGKESPGYSRGIIAIMPESYDVAMDNINLEFSRKILKEDIKFTVNTKSNIDVMPDEVEELKACKIRNGGKCKLLFNPKNYLIRQLIDSYLPENKYFSNSKLRYLFEQKEQITTEDFIDAVNNASGLSDLMIIFGLAPEQITIDRIDLFSVASTITSAEKNIIKINGKTFKIPVQMDPVLPSSEESITEEYEKKDFNVLLEFLSKFKSGIRKKRRLINLHVKPKSIKRRDYRHEYKKFQSSRSAKLARAARVRNRRVAERKHLVRKGDKIDLDHIDGNPMHNYSWNLHRLPRSKNRAKH